jgi:prepilin-type N-terminal cleavage/methylation domain-containing protein
MSSRHSTKRPRTRREGFTLLELLVVSVLMVGVTLMAAQFWASFSRDMVDMAARTITAQELRFVLSGLSEDFGACVGAVGMEDGRLVLCKDAGQYPNGIADWGSPDTLVEYSLSGKQLRRFDQSTGDEMTMADSVSNLQVEDVSASVVQVTVEIRRAGITREAVLLWSRP